MKPFTPIVLTLWAAALSNSAITADAGQDRLIRITRFDCVKEDEAGNAAEFPWPQGISPWASGGPGGAVWNASGLRCAVAFETDCTQGEAHVELRIGGALIAAKRVPIADAGARQAAFDLKPDRWEKHLDQIDAKTHRFPYRTATFSASVMASCQKPQEIVPGIGPRLEFADDRHFTAGFAKGE